ncbi:NAD(P)/FAD-dependent oxidoreductase [Methylobacterium radiodurans]|uniref:NADH:ubiquinone reductase (non-electrogenic) n=1 Tax=Methylobacterium radiodurans TaxID=2202828 RepID=A0A2U8VTT4_9HYPH|nr:NAD(P)/FAD-dependent oxidoreductase [Methylobacterium radiodurans]AWN37164.1 FAD-dependent oxidoreductase [Methylobacterium radiodurans]
MSEQHLATEPHVVIVGAGFGGLAAAKALAGSSVQVTIIDSNNYHLFVPLLYQVATAALSPADIAEPIRHILAPYPNIRVVMGRVTGVDIGAKRVHLAEGDAIAYDRLIIATGSTSSYFGHDDWAPHAPALKSIEEARAIRTRVLEAFERAEWTQDAAERRRQMTIVVVGGGPTGVEMAGSIAELARHALARDFRRIDPAAARVILVEAGPRLLTAFPEALASYAQRSLERLGVTVTTGVPVEAIDGRGVTMGGRLVQAATVIWGAGVRASPAASWLGISTDRSGRIPVAADLSVAGVPDVYALGDTALCRDASGQPLPGLAQVAQQQGTHLGRALRENLTSGTVLPPFVFRNRGNAAIVGRHAAIFDFGRGRRLKGFVAWLLWAAVHVVLLVDFAQRSRVTLQWLWRYLTYRRGARLITAPAQSTSVRG